MLCGAALAWPLRTQPTSVMALSSTRRPIPNPETLEVAPPFVELLRWCRRVRRLRHSCRRCGRSLPRRRRRRWHWIHKRSRCRARWWRQQVRGRAGSRTPGVGALSRCECTECLRLANGVPLTDLLTPPHATHQDPSSLLRRISGELGRELGNLAWAPSRYPWRASMMHHGHSCPSQRCRNRHVSSSARISGDSAASRLTPGPILNASEAKMRASWPRAVRSNESIDSNISCIFPYATTMQHGR